MAVAAERARHVRGVPVGRDGRRVGGDRPLSAPIAALAPAFRHATPSALPSQCPPLIATRRALIYGQFAGAVLGIWILRASYCAIKRNRCY